MADWVVAGTGPRRLQTADQLIRLDAAIAVEQTIGEMKEQHGGDLVVMSGIAEGFDHLLAVSALRAKVRLWAAVPNRGYGTYYWGRTSVTGEDRRENFEWLLSQAWRVTHVMEDVHRTSSLYLNGLHSNFVRNAWMVVGDPVVFPGGADEFVVWGSESRGTAHCLAEVRKAGKPYRILSESPAPAGVDQAVALF